MFKLDWRQDLNHHPPSCSTLSTAQLLQKKLNSTFSQLLTFYQNDRSTMLLNGFVLKKTVLSKNVQMISRLRHHVAIFLNEKE